MLILRGPALANSIANPDIRHLVQLRFAQVCGDETYDYDLHGYIVVVEPGDAVAALEGESSCALLHDPYEDVRFGHPDFTPTFETLEEHHGKDGTTCFEILFITNDDGFGITFLVPKADGIDRDLLAMCATYATPANVGV